MAHLITGYAGVEHIQSSDQGSFNAAFFGDGQYVMEIGNQFDASILDNNTVRILDGDLLMYGRHVRIETDNYEDMTIETGTAGKNRIDLICMTYEKNATDGTEKAHLEVIKGAESVSSAQDPGYTDGNILNGASKNQMPLYRVNIEGVVLSAITPMFTVIPTYKTLAEHYAAEFQEKCESHLNSLNVLDTMEEIEANTRENQLAGALAVKEGFENVNSNLATPTNGTGSLKTNSYFTMNECNYIVKGGWCKIKGIFTCNKNATAYVAFYQKIPANIFGNDYYNFAISSSDSITIKFETDGTIMASGGTVGNAYRFSCVYPVSLLEI